MEFSAAVIRARRIEMSIVILPSLTTTLKMTLNVARDMLLVQPACAGFPAKSIQPLKAAAFNDHECPRPPARCFASSPKRTLLVDALFKHCHGNTALDAPGRARKCLSPDLHHRAAAAARLRACRDAWRPTKSVAGGARRLRTVARKRHRITHTLIRYHCCPEKLGEKANRLAL